MKFPWSSPIPPASPSTPATAPARLRRIRSILRWLSLGLLALLVLLGALAWGAVRQSWPVESGRLQLAGLTAPVEVVRDPQGLPQIYAETTEDLIFAQGYIQAQDRFWQMDIWRHVGSGRLAEVFGEGQVETDLFLRTLGWEAIAEREWEQIQREDADLETVLSQYAAGVNAYLADRQGTELSLEHGILGLLNRNYQPAPWTPVNSLTWAKVMAYDLCKNLDDERLRLALKQILPPERV
ncbi:MAG: penicillin acylase family protein [Prochlorothrix sp.]